MSKANYQHLCGHNIYCNANAIISQPLTTYIAESYKNAYETAFKAEYYRELNLYPSAGISSNNLPEEFIDGTFGYTEAYGGAGIIYLIDSINNYVEQPYLFISTGSSVGSGFMYLNWIIVTFGVPYEIKIPKRLATIV